MVNLGNMCARALILDAVVISALLEFPSSEKVLLSGALELAYKMEDAERILQTTTRQSNRSTQEPNTVRCVSALALEAELELCADALGEEVDILPGNRAVVEGYAEDDIDILQHTFRVCRSWARFGDLTIVGIGLGIGFFVFNSSFSFGGALTVDGPARSSFVGKERSNSSPMSDRLSGIGDRGDKLSPSSGFREGICTC